ncbi:Phosphate ABC transporter, periplasmic phosphate-binding protein PstS (TC 3.A.1.7.1) [hydrothermal vent metagenome]|uniref:Phosphate ABC transporter, periplasmic phosphate-binding protein PstS (TC 3.A.1.7.1) n=1 Tax=hydrothermal vent metagenome TaxID=652676 RepID=A0A3B0V8W9_9ZZZZ
MDKKNIKGFKALGLLLAIITMVLIGGAGIAEAGRKLVKIDGSSTVFPITEAVAEEFQIAQRGKVMVTVGISGTGGGFKKFCRGEVDISDASRPIKPTEVALCAKNGIEYIELPVAYDGLAVMTHKSNNWVKYLTPKDLKKIWEPAAQGKIMKWSDVRPDWPKKTLRLYGPGVDSGTFDYFTKAINGKEGASRGDYTASEDDNVLVQGIASDKGSLGFFGLAYYEHNTDKLRLIPIDDGKDSNGKGPILPSLETVNNSTYQPLSRPIFIYVSKKSLDRSEIDEFVRFYITNANTLTKEVGYIPLPDNIYRFALKKLRKRTTGSAFGGKGSKTGVSIEDLVK